MHFDKRREYILSIFYNFLIRIVTIFIPSKKLRQEFRKRHLKRTTTLADILNTLMSTGNVSKIEKLLRIIIQANPNFYKASGPLKIIQKADLIFMNEILKAFDKHNIKYALMGGCLLGAYRHKGFIPWDDDIDLMMLREDYDKVQDILNHEFKKNNNVYMTKGDAIRIFFRNTPLQIDIFPFDLYNKYLENIDERKALSIKIENESKKIKYDFSRETTGNTIINKSWEEIESKRNELLHTDIVTEKKMIVYGLECIGKKPGVFDYDWVFPLKKYNFEDIEIFGPNRPEPILYWCYEDWSEIRFFDKPEHCMMKKRLNSIAIDIMLKIIETNSINL